MWGFIRILPKFYLIIPTRHLKENATERNAREKRAEKSRRDASRTSRDIPLISDQRLFDRFNAASRSSSLPPAVSGPTSQQMSGILPWVVVL